MRWYGTPGLSMGITDRNRTLRVSSYGYANIDSKRQVNNGTLFEIGSISKSFTDIALLQLVEEGRLDLNKPVRDYLPSFQVRSRYLPITSHHLMTHTAGIVTGTEGTLGDLPAMCQLRETEASCPPGEFFHYSNDGYKVLGLLLEALRGEGCGEVVEERILGLLGMSSSKAQITHELRPKIAVAYQDLYDDHPRSRKGLLVEAPWIESDTSDGSIVSTSDDMAKFLRMLLNRGKGPRGAILSEGSYALMTSPLVGRGQGLQDDHYGYGLSIRKREGLTDVGHTGGMVGHFSSVLMDLDAGLGVVVMINGPGAAEEVSEYVLSVMRAASSHGRLPKQRRVFPESAVENQESCVGRYASSSRTIEIVAKGQRLAVKVPGGQIMLEKVEQDYFHADHPDFRMFLLRFIRYEGRVNEVCYGGESFARIGSTVQELPDAKPDWAGYVGHYRSYDPWLSNFRIILRRSSLFLVSPGGHEEVLVPRSDGSFRVGEDERMPEGIRFDWVVDGVSMRAIYSGTDLYRTFTP
jgi:D-alanyl-D-alanine carboxypeptidase